MRWRILPIVLVFFTLISSVHAKKGHRSSVSGPRSSYYAIVAETGEVIAAQNEDTPLNPASNAKLVTAYCALKNLGPAHRFQTELYSDTSITDGTIPNLYIRGEGDPSLQNENLMEMVETLKAHGLKKIAGDVIVDASFFDNIEYPGRKEDNERPYNARTSAASLNHNSAEIFIEGTKKGPIVYLSPNISYFKINNRLRSGSRRVRVGISSRPDGATESLTVHGQIPRLTRPISFYKSVRNPPEFFANTMKALLEENGVPVFGEAKVGRVQGNHLLMTWQSKPLDLIVGDMNKTSNNFIAEQLTKYLGAKKFGPPGTTAKGTSLFKDCLSKIGIDTTVLYLENGSGLSYKNRITAKDLAQVILAGIRDPKIKDSFISSLSVADVDGTMKKRRTFRELKGVLKGKTGSLNAISTLAGVVRRNDGKTVVFAILLNDFGGGHYRAHRMQDSLVLRWVSGGHEP